LPLAAGSETEKKYYSPTDKTPVQIQLLVVRGFFGDKSVESKTGLLFFAVLSKGKKQEKRPIFPPFRLCVD
jgi:hypothetical protein